MSFLSIAVLCAAPALAVHEESVSHSRIEVRGAEATLELHCQTLSLFEGVTGLDADGDGGLSAEELAAGREAIGSYLIDCYRLANPVAPEAEGEWFAAQLTDLRFPSRIDAEARRFQWVEARIEFRAPREIGELVVHSRLFTERDPYHKDFLELTWNDEEPWEHLFRSGEHDWHFQPSKTRRPGVLATFLRLGFDHILGGYDHLCFLIVLIVASRSLRALLGVVTAFTVAHSITLGLAALDMVRFDSGFVELAIALSIAYVAVQNLIRRTPHTPWIEAFGFGLLHGLGFAGFLADALVGEPLVITALFGFNLGVEAGQVVFAVGFVLAVTAPTRIVRARRERAPGDGSTGEARTPDATIPDGLGPRWFRLAASAVVSLVALYWFVERAGWI